MTAGEPVPRRPRVGLFGGTFDPVHAGHLTLVHWARAELRLDQVRVIPTGRSWQKAQAGATGPQRQAMLELAFAGQRDVIIDDRELSRDGPSYTVDTLAALRDEYGSATALVFVLGSDQLHNLASWHRYRDLLALAHLAVTQREGIGLSNFPAPVEALVQAHGRDSLPDSPAGAIVFFRMPLVPVSATVLRQQLGAGAAAEGLVSESVLDYIRQNRIYLGQ